MKVLDIIKTLKVAGAATPAFKALFDHAVSTFREDEQDVLKAAYAKVQGDTDAVHDTLQSELADAAKKK